MTADTRRQGLLLAALLVVLAAVLWWNVGGGATPAPASSGRAPAAPAAGASASPAGPLDDVRLDALDAAPPEPTASHRNPFHFGGRRPAAAGSSPGFEPPVPYEPPAVVNGPASGVGTQAIPLRFIGVITEARPDRRLAVLTDGRNPPFYGREGDIIEGRYRIVRIGVESIELAHVDGRGQQTLRLSGS